MKALITVLSSVFIFAGCCHEQPTVKDQHISAESLLIDVRTPEEFDSGHLKNAINIPYEQISNEITKYATDKSHKVVLYCKSGRRASVALKTLNGLGYNNVKNVGGYSDLKDKGTP